ncbi:MAG: hypothetical protein ACRDAP_19175, partial [Shewanella sp.]
MLETPELLAPLTAAVHALLSFNAVDAWNKLPQTKLFELRENCQSIYEKIDSLQKIPALQQNKDWQFLSQGVIDELEQLWRYVELAQDGIYLYAELVTELESSESKLHSLCMALREKNPRLTPPDFTPIYYGRGIRDYFAMQRQQWLEQAQARQEIEAEKVKDAALKLFSVYKMGVAAETQELLKWQTDDSEKVAAAAKKPPEPIETTLSRLDTILDWDTTKVASQRLLQENREALTIALTEALTAELPLLTKELEYRALKHHRVSERAAVKAQIDRQREVEKARLRRLAQISRELADLTPQITTTSQDGDLGAASTSTAASVSVGGMVKLLSPEAGLFSALIREQSLLTSEQQEYESAQRRGQLSKEALESPIDAYKAAIHQQTQRHLIGGGLSTDEKERLVVDLTSRLQPILEEAARQGALAKTLPADLYKKAITLQMVIEDDPQEVQEAAEEDVREIEKSQRLKFIAQSDNVAESLIEQAASRIGSAMAKRVNLHLADKALNPITEAVVDTLRVALQEKYDQLLEENAEQKANTERVQEIKFKAEQCEKALIAEKPELALMAENRYELEQRRDARAEVLRQQLTAKQVKFDSELSQLKKQQQQCVAEGKSNNSQKL